MSYGWHHLSDGLARVNAATARLLHNRPLSIEITATLTDPRGQRASSTRTVRIPRMPVRIPVTG